jgi:hypothetical protein
MENIEGLPIVAPAKVLTAQLVSDPIRSKVGKFLKLEIGVVWIGTFIPAIASRQGWLVGFRQSIDDICEVATDPARNLVGIDLAIV